MKRVRTQKADMVLPSLLLLGDAIAIYSAAIITYAIRFSSGWFPTPLGVPSLHVILLSALVSTTITLVIFYQRGHYQRSGYGRLRRDLGGVATGLAFSLALQLSFLFFWRGISFSRTYMLSFAILAFVLVLLVRALLRRLQAGFLARGRGALAIALLGESPMTARVWHLFADRPAFGYRALGLIEDLPAPGVGDAGLEGAAQPAASFFTTAMAAAPAPAHAQGRPQSGVPGNAAEPIPHLGSSAELEAIARQHQLDAVVVTLPFSRYDRFVELAQRLSAIHVKAFLVPDLVGLMTTRLHHFELEGVPFLAFRHVPLSGLGRVLKRSFDIVVAALALLLLAPLFLLIALLVLADDGRPVFYGQIRLGRDGRRFRIRKFRTMRRDAEAQGAGWTQAQDDRRTRLGRLLRRTSLDELPQLWNVLRGEMSLVGPRPERPEFVTSFSATIPRYFERHRVRSGITGWAQVNGLRGDTPIEERTRYDLFYVENWSLAFDLKILWLTVLTIFSGRNAY